MDDWRRYDPKYFAVAQFLGIGDNQSWKKHANKLDYILDWAIQKVGEKGLESPQKVIRIIQKLEDKIGKPSWEEQRISHIFRRLRLDTDEHEVVKKKRATEEKPQKPEKKKEIKKEAEPKEKPKTPDDSELQALYKEMQATKNELEETARILNNERNA